MQESGSLIGTTRSTTNMRRIGIRKVLTRRVWSDRSAVDLGIARSRTSRRRLAGAADSRCKPMVQAFVVRGVLRTRLNLSKRSTHGDAMSPYGHDRERRPVSSPHLDDAATLHGVSR